MVTTAPVQTTKEYEQTPTGLHPARIYSLIHLGTQDSEMYGPMYKILLTFEITDELREYERDGEVTEKPMVMSLELTLSMNEKANLRKVVEAVINKRLTDEEAANFDVESIVGEACMVNVIESKTGKSKVGPVSPVMKGLKVPEQFNPTLIYTFGDSNFDKVPKWIQKKIQESPQWKSMEKAGNQDTDYPVNEGDGIPF